MTSQAHTPYKSSKRARQYCDRESFLGLLLNLFSVLVFPVKIVNVLTNFLLFLQMLVSPHKFVRPRLPKHGPWLKL